MRILQSKENIRSTLFYVIISRFPSYNILSRKGCGEGMPEYRRFIAYFYEYINGKKQKNVGFAKVELRSGMWRILFRLITDVTPQPPVQVYGFVRESGYLLGVPMGTMRPGREMAEEWAYRAGVPLAKKYRLEDLSGIWIQSGEGRCFLTVWDDEPIEAQRLVMDIPETAQPQKADSGSEEMLTEGKTDSGSEEMPTEGKVDSGSEEMLTEDEADSGSEGMQPHTQNVAETQDMSDLQGEAKTQDILDFEEEAKTRDILDFEEEAKTRDIQDFQGETKKQDMPNSCSEAEEPEKISQQAADMKCEKCCDVDVVLELLQKRQPFLTPQNSDFARCVRIMPCDVVRLQQEGYQAGRSSFLQHAFYQYRHLLLAVTPAGEYVLGVPGIQNPQERYMAEMFGYRDFRLPHICGCGRIFGYWCRSLCKE